MGMERQRLFRVSMSQRRGEMACVVLTPVTLDEIHRPIALTVEQFQALTGQPSFRNGSLLTVRAELTSPNNPQ
jgi:hypothetical protein